MEEQEGTFLQVQKQQHKHERKLGRVQHRVAIVCGGALGIGRQSSILLAKEGAKVAILDNNEKEGRKLADLITKSGGTAAFWKIDVTKESLVKSTFSRVRKQFGGINILVNIAELGGANKPTDKMTEREWDKAHAHNVKGTFFCTKHVISYMKSMGGGSIVTVTCGDGLTGVGDNIAYKAGKGALSSMTKNDALRYAANGIRVNNIQTGFIWTPQVETHLRMEGEADINKRKKMLEEVHPMSAVGEAVDVAWAVVFLASEESKFVNGAELVVDGGYSCQ